MFPSTLVLLLRCLHIVVYDPIKAELFYLFDYVTSTEIFQIGDRARAKKKTWTPVYHNFYVVTEAE